MLASMDESIAWNNKGIRSRADGSESGDAYDKEDEIHIFLLCYHRNSFDVKFDRRTKKFIFFLSYFSHHPCYGYMTVNTHVVFFALIGYVFGWIKTSCVSREFF
jgi:hypothetical protein